MLYNKPTIYNTPTIYNNGAGGIYKGRGVYNDGGGYNGPFVFLNNFNSIENEKSKSEIGPDFLTPTNNFLLINSDVFNGEKCLFMNSAGASQTENNIDVENTFTCETYFSNFNSISSSNIGKVRFGNIFIQIDGLKNNYRIQVPQGSYTLYNGTTYYTNVAGWNYFLFPIQPNEILHMAFVVCDDLCYCFCNGNLMLKTQGNFQKNFSPLFYAENSTTIKCGINFLSVRNGDFSNNLTSFNVPTQKYTLS